MRRVASLLHGPEGLWIAISLLAFLFATRNEPSTAAGRVDCHDSYNSGLVGTPCYSLSIGWLLLEPLAVRGAVLICSRSGE